MKFDITRHEWSDSAIGQVVVDDCNLIIEDYEWDVSSISINKQDATAIAKHFGLTADWIVSSESLPEIDKSVLIADLSDGGILYDFARWNGEYWTRKGWPLGFSPSHWMPLPQPPQSKE